MPMKKVKKKKKPAVRRPPSKVFVIYSTKSGEILSTPMKKFSDAKLLKGPNDDSGVATYGLLERKNVK